MKLKSPRVFMVVQGLAGQIGQVLQYLQNTIVILLSLK